ncbi:hypothetical protein FIBSPDRAFT_882140 [Athelia psychrophila]|uniref:Uncharacterized protein n=1 Tax=Athelia psychrophila TaxID=1759441 RepID=A0A166VJY8_9AGAM|nr:hypothetical protein FIBSPDRAFT_882140 [Fibularhizoctonia sp. CBS 109695]
MYTYDWLLSISEEVVIVSQGSLTWSITIYFLSRTSQLVFLLLAIAFKSSWVNCTAFFAWLIISSSVAIASTSFLFFLRVRAVYLQSRTITILFGALWVVTASVSIGFGALTVHGAERIPHTAHCTNTIAKYNFIPVTMTFVHDTMVFLAISYRLAAGAVAAADWRSRVLATTVFFFVNLATMTSPSLHYNWLHYNRIGLWLDFTNMMACLVFRGVALGQIEKAPTQFGLTSTAINGTLQTDVLPLPQLYSLEALRRPT